MAESTRDQAAVASAGMYRSLFEGSPHPMLIVDRGSLHVLRANAAAVRRYGYSLSELVNLRLSTLWPGAEQVLLQGQGTSNVQRLVHRNGEESEASVELQEVFLAGQPAIALHITDLTEQRFTAAVLEAHNRVLETMARGSPLAVVLEELVRQMERLSSGMIGSVLLMDTDGRHAYHGAAPSLPPEYWKAIDGLAIGPASGSCGTAMFLNQPVIVEDIATDPLWNDYRTRALLHGLRACWSTPIRSSAGEVLGSFAIYYRQPGAPRIRDRRLVDVATHLAAVAIERDMAGRPLESESRLWAIIDHAFAAVSLKDVDGRYLLVNRRFEQITGIAAAVARGRTDQQLFPWRLAEAYSANDREVLQARKGVQFEEEILQPDGVHVHLAIKFPLLHPGGGAYGIGAILCDITERKRVERALERSREELRVLTARLQSVREEERTRISREIHDELGQMLTSLHLNQSLLIDSVRERVPGEDWIGAELASMQEAAAKMLQSVRRIAAELRPEALDKRGLAAAVEWQAAEFAKRTGIACSVLLPDAPMQVDMERATALFRILQEALTNVARHAGASEVEVVLRQDAAFFEMSVADNGRGFSEAAQPGAASLGLLGMRERAAAFGGATTVTSMPGRGTTVAVRIAAS